MAKFAANISMLFSEHAFLDRFAAAADAGFKAVECQFPYDTPPGAVAERLARYGLEMVLHNLPPGDLAKGDRGLACLPDRKEEFRSSVTAGIEYARAVGCGRMNCLSGIRPSGVDPAIADATLIDSLRLAADATAKAGIRLLVEPINRHDFPGFHLDKADRAMEMIGAVGSENVFLQYDLYHQQRTAGELVESYRRHKHRIAHIQLADNPGRNEPGTGEINFPFVLAEIDHAGYQGWIGCEYRPKGDTVAGLAWMKSL